MTYPKTFKQARTQTAQPSTESRRQHALQRLGHDNPRCAICGESDPRCLELHHIAGQAFDDVQAPVCRNCHRKASDAQRDHSPTIDDAPELIERAAHLLLGMADLFALLVETCRAFATMLLEYVRGQSQAPAPAMPQATAGKD